MRVVLQTLWCSGVMPHLFPHPPHAANGTSTRYSNSHWPSSNGSNRLSRRLSSCSHAISRKSILGRAEVTLVTSHPSWSRSGANICERRRTSMAVLLRRLDCLAALGWFHRQLWFHSRRNAWPHTARRDHSNAAELQGNVSLRNLPNSNRELLHRRRLRTRSTPSCLGGNHPNPLSKPQFFSP